MFRRTCLALVVSATAAASLSLVPSAAQALPPTELMGDRGPVIPLKDGAMLTRSDWGYRYRAGQQDSNLTVTYDDGRLLYVDTGTKELRKLAGSCRRVDVDRGIAASCKIPDKFSGDKKMFLEIWPRLGDDTVDAHTLGSKFRLWALMDDGKDTVYAGAGDDFVNGAMGVDKIVGGTGDDWLRAGTENDDVWGGDGNDKIVGGDQADAIHGGSGNDWLGGGNGNDSIWAEIGRDVLSCGSGGDGAHGDGDDRFSACESVSRS